MKSVGIFNEEMSRASVYTISMLVVYNYVRTKRGKSDTKSPTLSRRGQSANFGFSLSSSLSKLAVEKGTRSFNYNEN